MKEMDSVGKLKDRRIKTLQEIERTFKKEQKNLQELMAAKDAEVEMMKEDLNEYRKVEIANEEMKQKVNKLAAELEEEKKMKDDIIKFKEEVKNWKSKCKIEVDRIKELEEKSRCNEDLTEWASQALDQQRKEQKIIQGKKIKAKIKHRK